MAVDTIHPDGETQPVSLDVFLVDGVEWSSLTIGQRRRLYAALEKSAFWEEPPNRYAFTRVGLLNHLAIYGYFSQEYEDVIRHYDQAKRPRERLENNFVDLLFVLRLDSGVLLLQDRRFHNEGSLSMGHSRSRFSLALAATLRELGYPNVAVTPREEITTSKVEFLRLMRHHRVVDLRVEGLEGQRLPDDFVLFNPDIDHEKAFREIWSEHEQRNLSNLQLRAAKRGNLADSKIAKAASHAGQPEALEYEAEEDGTTVRRVIRRRISTHIGEIQLCFPVTAEDVRRILKVLGERAGGPRRLRAREQPVARQLTLNLPGQTDAEGHAD